MRPDKPALSLEELGPYYLGTYFARVAMQKKLDGEAREEVEGYQKVVKEYMRSGTQPSKTLLE